jgi:hypothetical protein
MLARALLAVEQPAELRVDTERVLEPRERHQRLDGNVGDRIRIEQAIHQPAHRLRHPL